MPSLCHSLKQEYEALQTLTQEFVSACEKAGDPRALSADQLRTLQIQKQKLEQARDAMRDKLGVSPEVAREILGDDFCNERNIQEAFEFTVPASEIPRIPYNRKMLERAKVNGEALILRVAYDGERNPMTIQRMQELLSNQRFQGSWMLLREEAVEDFKREPFFNNQPLATEWKLVSHLGVVKQGVDTIPSGQPMMGDYVQRTIMMREYLHSVGALTAEEERGCSDDVLQRICQQMGVEWLTKASVDQGAYELHKEEAARRLVSMKVNTNHGRTPAEVMYDLVLLGEIIRSEADLNRRDGSLSNTLSSDGRIVAVFRSDFGGMTIRTVEANEFVSMKPLVIQR